jgi:hypothetical protein
VKLIGFGGVCGIELIWAIQNIDIQIQKTGFGVSAIKKIGQLIYVDNWVLFVGFGKWPISESHMPQFGQTTYEE